MKENDVWGWMLTRCIMEVIYNVYKYWVIMSRIWNYYTSRRKKKRKKFFVPITMRYWASQEAER